MEQSLTIRTHGHFWKGSNTKRIIGQKCLLFCCLNFNRVCQQMSKPRFVSFKFSFLARICWHTTQNSPLTRNRKLLQMEKSLESFATAWNCYKIHENVFLYHNDEVVNCRCNIIRSNPPGHINILTRYSTSKRNCDLSPEFLEKHNVYVSQMDIDHSQQSNSNWLLYAVYRSPQNSPCLFSVCSAQMFKDTSCLQKSTHLSQTWLCPFFLDRGFGETTRNAEKRKRD